MIKYIICNLKANKSKAEMTEYEKELKNLPSYDDIEIVICPSAPFLFLFNDARYSLGAQDISEFESGAYTGEITGGQLSSMNTKYALIGHSERRSIIKETQQTITNKIKRAYHHHIRPVYFIGETKEQRESHNTQIILLDELIEVIDQVPDYKRSKMIVVYEPIWAIGTGETPSIEEISSNVKYIKIILKTHYNIEIPVLYGGSISKENIKEISSITDLDGLVMGESAKDCHDLFDIINLIKFK